MQNKERGERVILSEEDIFPIDLNHKNTMTTKVHGPDH